MQVPRGSKKLQPIRQPFGPPASGHAGFGTYRLGKRDANTGHCPAVLDESSSDDCCSTTPYPSSLSTSRTTTPVPKATPSRSSTPTETTEGHQAKPDSTVAVNVADRTGVELNDTSSPRPARPSPVVVWLSTILEGLITAREARPPKYEPADAQLHGMLKGVIAARPQPVEVRLHNILEALIAAKWAESATRPGREVDHHGTDNHSR